MKIKFCLGNVHVDVDVWYVVDVDINDIATSSVVSVRIDDIIANVLVYHHYHVTCGLQADVIVCLRFLVVVPATAATNGGVRETFWPPTGRMSKLNVLA